MLIIDGFNFLRGLNDCWISLEEHVLMLLICIGEVVEYEQPGKLMQREGSLFRELVREYSSQSQHAN
jgi:hypothetical protein